MTKEIAFLFDSKEEFVRHLAYLDAQLQHVPELHPRYDANYPLPPNTTRVSHLDAYMTGILTMCEASRTYELERTDYKILLYPEFDKESPFTSEGTISSCGFDHQETYDFSQEDGIDPVIPTDEAEEDFLRFAMVSYHAMLHIPTEHVRLLLQNNKELHRYYADPTSFLDWDHVSAGLFARE